MLLLGWKYIVLEKKKKHVHIQLPCRSRCLGCFSLSPSFNRVYRAHESPSNIPDNGNMLASKEAQFLNSGSFQSTRNPGHPKGLGKNPQCAPEASVTRNHPDSPSDQTKPPQGLREHIRNVYKLSIYKCKEFSKRNGKGMMSRLKTASAPPFIQLSASCVLSTGFGK